jgi:hypothetical protein
MADPELEALRQKRLNELQQAQGGPGGGAYGGGYGVDLIRESLILTYLFCYLE